MNENVNVCITPKGEKPVLHFSQFDNERVFTVTVLADDGESAAVLTGLDIEFRIRKTDSHVVTIAPESVADNVITFKTTEQMCACCGQNIASVVLRDSEMIVSTLDILVDIQRDILSGGLTSESDIRNLTTQIEQIVPEVIGDDYYTKTEVDELIDDIPTFDPSNYYNKSDVDGLLADKADSDDVYTKTETDNLLSAKMNNIGYHGVVDDAAVISFTTDCNAPLAIIKGKIDPNPSGFSALNVTRTGKNLLSGKLEDYQASTRTYGLSTFISYKLPNDTYTISTNAPTGYIWAGKSLDNGALDTSTYFRVYDGNPLTITLSGTQELIVGVLTTDKETACSYNTMVNIGSSPSEYHAYNGQTVTVNFGQSVTIGGVFDLTNGKITLSDDTEISVTPVTISSISGDNNIFIDTGNMTEIAYFENAEDNLIKLIKAFQI